VPTKPTKLILVVYMRPNESVFGQQNESGVLQVLSVLSGGIHARVCDWLECGRVRRVFFLLFIYIHPLYKATIEKDRPHTSASDPINCLNGPRPKCE